MSRYLTARNVILLSGISVTLGFAVVIGYRPELLPPAVTRRESPARLNRYSRRLVSG